MTAYKAVYAEIVLSIDTIRKDKVEELLAQIIQLRQTQLRPMVAYTAARAELAHVVDV